MIARFEDAIAWVVKGGRARRSIWADLHEYTKSTPPLNVRRRWHIWMSDENVIWGWGGIEAGVSDGPIRDGSLYRPSDDDRVAQDWEML